LCEILWGKKELLKEKKDDFDDVATGVNHEYVLYIHVGLSLHVIPKQGSGISRVLEAPQT
jgi:hypothetical protein